MSTFEMRPPRAGDPGRGILDEEARGGTLPLRIARRKMRADIAVADRAEERVGQRMQRHVGIRMPDEARVCAILTPPSQT